MRRPNYNPIFNILYMNKTCILKTNPNHFCCCCCSRRGPQNAYVQKNMLDLLIEASGVRALMDASVGVPNTQLNFETKQNKPKSRTLHSQIVESGQANLNTLRI